MKRIFEFKLNKNLCTGCRICELVCSFHFHRAFGGKAGAIEVQRYEAEGRFEPIINEGQVSFLKICDLCQGEKKYLCINYCTAVALEISGGREYGGE